MFTPLFLCYYLFIIFLFIAFCNMIQNENEKFHLLKKLLSDIIPHYFLPTN